MEARRRMEPGIVGRKEAGRRIDAESGGKSSALGRWRIEARWRMEAGKRMEAGSRMEAGMGWRPGGGWRPGVGWRPGADEEAALVAGGRWRLGAEVEIALAGAGRRPGMVWTAVTHRKALY